MNNRQERLNGIRNILKKSESIVEAIFLSIIYYIVWRHTYSHIGFPGYLGRGKYMLCAVYFLIVYVIFDLCDSFKFGHLKLMDLIISQWVSILIVNIITYFQLCLIANKMIPFKQIILLIVVDYIFVLCVCYIYTVFYHIIYVPKDIIMIYGDNESLILKNKIDTRKDRYKITETIKSDKSLSDIIERVNNHDAVIINDVDAKKRNDILKYCYQNQIRTYIAPKLSDIIVTGASNVNLFDTPLILVRGRGIPYIQRITKRIFDLILSLMATVILAPLMIIVALLIKSEDGGPVFYRQDRVTRNGKVFSIIKFRSMIVNAEKDGKSIPCTDNDSRITKIGKIIRPTRIDELPQLFNIIKGDMSIVGPRPERVEHVKKYSEEIPEFSMRLKVKGGLTGYAQIYGKYNTTAYDKLRYDLMYIENYSILLDIKLILMTIRIMCKKESTEGF